MRRVAQASGTPPIAALAAALRARFVTITQSRCTGMSTKIAAIAAHILGHEDDRAAPVGEAHNLLLRSQTI